MILRQFSGQAAAELYPIFLSFDFLHSAFYLLMPKQLVTFSQLLYAAFLLLSVRLTLPCIHPARYQKLHILQKLHIHAQMNHHLIKATRLYKIYKKIINYSLNYITKTIKYYMGVNTKKFFNVFEEGNKELYHVQADYYK